MKIWCSILSLYFGIVSFIPQMDFSQISYLDDMLTHFHLHKTCNNSQNTSISFTTFIYIHYIDQGAHSELPDHDSHQNLPFHTLNFHFTGFFLPFPDRYIGQMLLDTSYSASYQNPFYLKEFCSSFFRPPSFR